MARPRKHKNICSIPTLQSFNKNRTSKEQVNITIDEFEVIRLIDYEGLTQMECAKQMQVARTTITSVYDNVRYKISDSIINNKEIVINGGDFEICKNITHCCGHCGKSKCPRCKHGSCENCIGIFHEAGRECYVLQN